MKKELERKAEKRQFEELVAKMKRFALCDDYKALYDKVVPPVAEMDTLTQKTTEEVEQLKTIIAKYDADLCVKASK